MVSVDPFDHEIVPMFCAVPSSSHRAPLGERHLSGVLLQAGRPGSGKSAGSELKVNKTDVKGGAGWSTGFGTGSKTVARPSLIHGPKAAPKGPPAQRIPLVFGSAR